jgi:hypothetical protein
MKIIAYEIVIEEMLPFLPPEIAYQTLDIGFQS